eukprot:TRINITY_DN8218_c0_g1_i1.p1 TRINITY_DN8218_c0_g1~~TRINITY_DN8218_c0_g1_i1.p1  ORF type:complete len:473 (-),score=147.97 TRINITY_DN8218_c0_g1_i1:56-1309(-)
MGQLGLGAPKDDASDDDGKTEIKRITPIESLTKKTIVASACYAFLNAFVVKEEKKKKFNTFTWGLNDDGQLGREGDEASSFSPGLVPSLAGKHIISVSAGDYHMAAVDSEGELYIWGTYKDQEFLGMPHKKYKEDRISEPQLVPDEFFPGGRRIKFQAVASGANFTVFVSENGDLYECGWTDKSVSSRPKRENLSRARIGLKPLKLPPKTKATYVACGQVHGVVLLTDKTVASWGFDHNTQLGLGIRSKQKDSGAPVERPHLIKDLEDITAIACGGFHNLALKSDGTVYAWGSNKYGELGLGVEEYKANVQNEKGESVEVTKKRPVEASKPTVIPFFEKLPEGEKVVHIACGADTSYALTNKGKVYSWGFGKMCLGFGEPDSDLTEPKHVTNKGLTGFNVQKILSGSTHTLFIAKNE